MTDTPEAGLTSFSRARARVLSAPFVPQWASRELTSAILRGEMDARDDPRWAETGASSPEEYAFWSWNWCGMACLSMVLASRSHQVSIMELSRRCLARGGYVVRGDTIEGLFYAPAVALLREEFGISAHVASPLSLEEIAIELERKHFVIASVHPGIRQPQTTPPTRGGHLVLLLGHDPLHGRLVLHNPSGDTLASQEYCAVAVADFERFFACRGVVIEDN